MPFKISFLLISPTSRNHFDEAMEDINKTKWEEAMRDEYLSLIHNETGPLLPNLETAECFEESGLKS